MSSSERAADSTPHSGRSLTAPAFATVVVGYPLVWWATSWVIASGDDHAYGEFVTVTTLALVLTVPAVAAATFVATTVGVLRWWRPVVVESLGADPRNWWFAGAAGAVAVSQLAIGHLLDQGVGYVLVAAVTCGVIALGTEALLRGIALEHLRRSSDEPAAAAGAALVHVVLTLSFFVVETPATLLQLVALATLGDVWYLLRRASGTALVPAAVHGVLLFGLLSSRWAQPQRAGAWELAGIVGLIVMGAVATTVRRRLEPPSRRANRAKLARLGQLAGAIALLIVIAMVVPVSSRNLDAHPDPAATYDEAVARFDTIADVERTGDVHDACHSRLLDQGRRAEVSVVLFHGLTNCPRQFVELGRELQADGANVLILRAPHHGLASGDRIGDVGKVGSLSAQELRDYADEAIDIAAGLGDEVRVLGLSMGGVVAMWAAQHRDVDRVVAVAPAVAIPRVPHVATTAMINLATRLPDVSLPSGGVELDHTYAGESTGALAAMFLLAQANENELTRHRSAADEVVVVVNPDDDQVDLDDVRGLVSRWDDASGPVEVVELPADGLPHDVIDVAQPTGDTALVYPLLIDLLEGSD